eukprot:g1181.t1
MEFPIGIGIQIVGCLSVALGICVEKYAIVKLESDSESTKSVTTDPTYLMGFGLFIFGNALSALALSYAAASILAPLSCLNIVANVFFSSWLLSEQVTMNDITSTCIILTGAATVVIFSSDSDESEEETSVNLLRLIFRTESILYICTVSIVVISLTLYLMCYYPSTRSLKKKKRRSSSLSELESCVNSSLKSTSIPSAKEKESMLSVAAFAGLSAAFGAASYMCSKIMSVTVSNMMRNDVACTHCIRILAVSVTCILLFAVLQVHWLNEALRIQDCLTVVPAYYALAILIQSISAAIIFDELSSYKPKQSVAYVVGISILILGVFRLSNRHVNNDSGKLVELSKSMVENVPDEERIHLLRKTPDQLWRKDRLRNLRRLRAASAASISIGL